MFDQLVGTLSGAGKPTHTYTSSDGSRVLLLPHGGRVLGLFPAAGVQENFYWTHPALRSPESAAAFYASDAWHNSGGDRTWLAPEVDIFFPKYPDLDMSTYWQPRQLDPGKYELVEKNGTVRLLNRLTLTLSRSKEQVVLEMSKWVGPALNPLRYERDWEPGGVQYAGYTQHTALKFEEPVQQTSAQIGLWNLVQMPHGGELLVATYSKAEPKVYMGEIAPDDLIVTDQLVRYRMRAKGEHKIGLRGVAMTGRVGYLYRTGGEESALIIRNFFVNPSGEYVDVPWREPANLGFAIQACNVDSGLGSFSELEYHVPAIGGAAGLTSYEDVSQIWAFRGPAESIRAIASRLLGDRG